MPAANRQRFQSLVGHSHGPNREHREEEEEEEEEE